MPSLPSRLRDFAPSALNRVFWLFVLIHATFWTFAPPFFSPYFRLDTAEMITIGKNWVLATYKHPAFQSWVLESLFQVTGGVDFTPYLAAQLAVVLTIWCIWKMAREFLSPQMALVAALAMLTYYFFSYESINYNNRTFMRAFGTLSMFLVFRAFKTNQLRYWFGTALSLSCGLYCNLATFLLILGIVSFMIVDSNTRKYWRSVGPYVTTGLTFVLFIPFLVWLFSSHFAPFTYAESSLSGLNLSHGHVTAPLRFTLGCLGLILPLSLVLIPEVGVGWKWNVQHIWGKTMEERFLFFMTAFPFLVTCMIAAISGHRLRTALGCQIWVFVPIFILYSAAQVREDWTAVRRSLQIIAVFMVVSAALSVFLCHFSPLWSKHAPCHYPGRRIAAEVTQLWESRFHTPLAYLRGDEWPGMAICIYGKTQPEVFSPLWSSEEDFRKKGGVLLWQKSVQGEMLKCSNFFGNKDFRYAESREPDPEWLAQFPTRIDLPDVQILPTSPYAKIPVTIGIALLPPEEKNTKGP